MDEKIKDYLSWYKDLLLEIHGRDLVDILFLHPYTKIEFLVRGLNIHRETSSIYLKNLENIGILKSTKLGRQKYYINTKLYELLKK